MDIAIIGAGNVGRALCQSLQRQGCRVRFGVPDPSRYQHLATPGGTSVSVGTVREAVEAVEGIELVILATPYLAALQVAREFGPWGQRILVDASNPIEMGFKGLAVGTTSSGAERIAEAATGARVVKAFNTTGCENMQDPQYPAGGLFMPIAGDDADAKARVVALATLIGFDAVDLGGLAASRYLEPWAMVWIELAVRRGHGRHFGFIRQQRIS